MKKLKIKKLATVLAVAMLLSLAMPVLALAAPYFGNADGVKAYGRKSNHLDLQRR